MSLLDSDDEGITGNESSFSDGYLNAAGQFLSRQIGFSRFVQDHSDVHPGASITLLPPRDIILNSLK